jgi:hypothetical protein
MTTCTGERWAAPDYSCATLPQRVNRHTFCSGAHGQWVFHIICADVERQFDAFCGQETDATGWFTREEMRNLTLHPGLRAWLEQCSG